MKKRSLNLWLALLLAGGLAACGEDSLLEPDTPQQTELDLMVDSDVTEATVVDAQAALAAVLGAPAPSADVFQGTLFGDPDPTKIEEARALLEQARQKFLEARQAWIGGDTEKAAELALEGRLLVAEAYILVFGEEAYDRLLERVDHVISWLEQQADDQVSELLARISELRDEAVALRGTDLKASLERLILALQIANRERAIHRQQELIQHARLSLFMAMNSIGLAVEVVGDDPTEQQIHALRHTQHLTQEAMQACNAGRYRLCLYLAREAVNVSLVAVVLEFAGQDAGLVQAMIELSNRAIAAAEEALSSTDPNEFAVRLLEHAKQLQQRVLEIVDIHPRVAVHVLWHVSVTAYGVIQIASGG